MTEREHHLLCVGLLARLWFQDRDGFINMHYAEIKAIEQAIDSAEEIGLPVKAANLRNGLPVCTRAEN